MVHIPYSVVDLLREHREASTFNRDEDFIFARSDGRPYDQDQLRNMVLCVLWVSGVPATISL